MPVALGGDMGLDAVLLDVKLSVPGRRPGLVTRAALTDARWDAEAATVGVTAPAGYGKSTLLIERAHVERRKVGWISLDAIDDHPSTLLFLLASAFERAVPAHSGLAAAISGVGAAALRSGTLRLAAAFQQASAPFVLLIDDLHELRSPECHDVLGVVLAAIPMGCQVVTASRHEQPHLAGLRVAGGVVELAARDLTLDAAAAERIFATAGISIDLRRAHEVVERTEGWPAGLQLAALVAREEEDGAPSVTGTDRYVSDYLEREVFRRLEPAEQRFLRRTAVLDELHGPLCGAVLGEPEAQDRLRDLEASSAFLVPLDRRRERYRCHTLFREFLLGELHRHEPELIEELHLRAADWFESHDAPAAAVEHLLGTHEQRRCTELVAELVQSEYGSGHASTVQRWMKTLGHPAIEAYPPLAVLAGWVAAWEGGTVEALRWAAVADDAFHSLATTDRRASFAASRSVLRAMMCSEGHEQMVADAELASGDEEWSVWRPSALCVLAEARLLAGEPARAEMLFEDATRVGLAMGDSVPVALSESGLALISMDDGRWDEASEHVELALSTIEQHHLDNCAISLMPRAVAARLAVHQADLTQADLQIARAMRARSASTFVFPCLAARGRLQLARACWTRGDYEGARVLLREIDDVLRRRPGLGTLVGEIAAFREMTTSATPGTAPRGVALTPAELRVLPYLQTHLRIADIAQRLHVSRNTVASEVSAVYRKLGVTSRGEAVSQATLLGLLGG
ncbi:LuxR family transcriptional regulator [Aeromicrobium sp. S22]|nr:LuxR family transcriptional regulator [Aeromicrobium sp. S22]